MILSGKKLSTAVLSILMCFILLFACVSVTSSRAASTFTARTTAPTSDNKYYYSNINPFYACGYGMPNCTAYAYGRAYELLGSAPKLCTSSAHKWYDYNKDGGYYKYGSEPALGAIACWSRGSSGHVAVVEAISGSNITISESHYNGRNFDTVVLTKGNESSYAGAFQGYIYVLGNGSTSNNTSDNTSNNVVTTKTDFQKVVESRGYPIGNYTTNTGSSNLNMRSGAGTGYSRIASVPNGTTLYVSKISGTWGQTTYNGKTGYISLEYCKFKGLGKLDGTWYKFNGDDIETSFNGYAKNQNGIYKVTKGIVSLKETGLFSYNGGTYYVKNSRVRTDLTTLVKVNGTWYYIKNGKTTNYTGLVSYNGSTYYVQNGICTLKYNGKVTYNGKTYTVQKSKVVS